MKKLLCLLVVLFIFVGCREKSEEDLTHRVEDEVTEQEDIEPDTLPVDEEIELSEIREDEDTEEEESEEELSSTETLEETEPQVVIPDPEPQFKGVTHQFEIFPESSSLLGSIVPLDNGNFAVLSNTGKVVCFSESELIWAVNTGATVSGRTRLAAGGDYLVLTGTKDTRVFSVNDGSLLYQKEYNELRNLLEHVPLIVGDKLYLILKNGLGQIGLTKGEVLGRFEGNAGPMGFSPVHYEGSILYLDKMGVLHFIDQQMNDTFSLDTDLAFGDSHFLSANLGPRCLITNGSKLYCINLQQKQVYWKKGMDLDLSFTEIIMTETYFYIYSNQEVRAFLWNGEEVLTGYPLNGVQKIPALTAGKNLIWADSEGILTVSDGDDGRERARFDGEGISINANILQLEGSRWMSISGSRVVIFENIF